MSGFSFDAKAALNQARRARRVPTLPTLPTDASPKSGKVGTVGTVGSGVDTEITHQEIAANVFEERGVSHLLKVSQLAKAENTKPGVANVESVATPGAPQIGSQYEETVGGRLAT
jgi:hypothetical protein